MSISREEQAKRRGLNILALDGGGVRGLSSAITVEWIMHSHNERRKKDGLEPQQPWQVFDLICGTSTGGLLAIMLGRLRMSAEKCRKAYEELIKTSFKKRRFSVGFNMSGDIRSVFSSEHLRSSILSFLREMDMDENTLLWDDTDDLCRVFVCATMHETRDLEIIRSYGISQEPSMRKLTIIQAAMATSAAAPFFDPVKIEHRTYCDGAFKANNPVFEAITEGRKIWCSQPDSSDEDLKEHIRSIVSVGNGVSMKDSFGSSVKELIKSLAKLTTETQTNHQKFSDLWPENQYFRFNVEQGIQNVQLLEFKKAGKIEAATMGYLREDKEIERKVRRCVDAMNGQARVLKPRYAIDPRSFDPKPGIFVERPTLIEIINREMFSSKRARTVLSLYGMSGTGKTELARAFCRRHIDRIPVIFEVSGRSEDEFVRDMFAQQDKILNNVTTLKSTRHGLDDLHEFLKWLNNPSNNPWLILIDDVCLHRAQNKGPSQPCTLNDVPVMSYIQRLNQGNIIITSQYNISDKANIGIGIDVSGFQEDESVELLDRSLNTPQPKSELRKLARRLDNHPLAVDAAAAHINSHPLQGGIRGYIKLWDSCDSVIWPETSPSFERQTLSKSLQVAFDRLSEAAQNLLLVCGFLDSRDIWFDLLRKSEDPWISGSVSSFAKFQAVIDELSSLRLLLPARGSGGQNSTASHELGFSIHPVVHKLVRSMAKSRPSVPEKKMTRLAVRLLSSSIQASTGSDYYTNMRRLCPHAVECCRNIELLMVNEDRSNSSNFREMLDDLAPIARMLLESGSAEWAATLYDLALDEFRSMSTIPEDLEETYYFMTHNRGRIYRTKGQHKEARSCFQTALEYIERRYDVDTRLEMKSTVMFDLGVMLRKEMKFLEAENQFHEVLKLQEYLSEATQGADCQFELADRLRVRSWKTRQQLGCIYIDNNKFDLAEKTLTEVKAEFVLFIEERNKRATKQRPGHQFRAFEEEYDQSHGLEIALLTQDISRLYRKKGDFHRALEVLESARSEIKKFCDPGSDLLLKNTWLRLKVCQDHYQAQSRSKKSLLDLKRKYEKFLDQQRRYLGPDHHSTLRTVGSLGILLWREYETVDARNYLHQAVAGYQKREFCYDQARAMLYLGKSYTPRGKDKVARDPTHESWSLAIDIYNKLLDQLQRYQVSPNEYAWGQLRTDLIIQRARAVSEVGTDEEKFEALHLCSKLDGRLDNSVRHWIKRELDKIEK